MHHPALDVFFTYATFFGDGFIYIPVLLYAVIFNRKYFIPLAAGVLFCTILAQGVKRIVNAPRPIHMEDRGIVIRKIEGQNINRQHSFPSGHTSTAFTVALMFVTIIKRKAWAIILPAIAILVAYSRVYLAQHYVTDVLGGMTVGLIASYCALWVFQAYLKRTGRESELETKKI